MSLQNSNYYIHIDDNQHENLINTYNKNYNNNETNYDNANTLFKNGLMQGNNSKTGDFDQKYIYQKMSLTEEPVIPIPVANNVINIEPSESKVSNASSTSKVKDQPIKLKKYQIEYPFKTIKHRSNNIYVWNMLKSIVLFLVNLIVMTPIVAYLAVVYSLNQLFKYMFKLFHLCHLTASSHFSPNSVPEFLKPMELFWLYSSNLIRYSQSADTERNEKNICSCIVFVEGNLSKKNVKDLVQNRIISSNLRTGQRFLVRFTQRLYRLFAYCYVWLDCESTFNIDDHIVEVDTIQEITNNQQLQDYVAKLITTHEFKMSRPLWQIYFKKNFGSGSDQVTVLIFLFHMCFADGISLVRVFFKTIVDNRNTIDIKSRFAFRRLKTDLFRQFFFNFNTIFYYLLCKKCDKNILNRSTRSYFNDPNNLSDSEQSESSKQTLRWSEPFSLVLINRMKLVTRSKLNDFFMSTVAGIIRDYLQKKGINNPQNVHCLMPINLTSNRYPNELSNQTVISSFKLPSNTEGCIPRLWSTKLATSKLKYSSDYLFFYFFICIVFNALPHCLAVRLIKFLVNKNTLIASTLGAGDTSLSTVSLCNKNVRNMLFVYPTLCKVAISFSIITYGDEVRLCILSDSDIIKNPDQITDEFIKQLETLNYLLANRRIPGEVRRVIKTTHVSPLNRQISVPIEVNPSSSDTTIEEMQHKLNEIHHELQVLTDIYQNLDSKSLDFNKQKQMLNVKRESLKREFRGVIMKLQIKKNSFHKTIPSDDEDELDPEERIRLRSSSVASKSSGSNNSRKLRESNSDFEKASRKPSISNGSLQNSHSSISNVAAFVTSNSNIHTKHDNETIGKQNNGNHLSSTSSNYFHR